MIIIIIISYHIHPFMIINLFPQEIPSVSKVDCPDLPQPRRPFPVFPGHQPSLPGNRMQRAPMGTRLIPVVRWLGLLYIVANVARCDTM